MATVTKDFKIKSGLVVEGTNGTINGSDIITEDIITGGTQTNISVTYNPTTKTLDFAAENGVADSTTDDLDEGSNNLYFTDARARGAISVEASGPLTYNSTSGELDLKLTADPGLGVDSVTGGLEMKNVASNVGTFGSTTNIPSITVDNKGRVTAVTTNSVATTLTVEDNSGTQDSVNLLTDKLKLAAGNGVSTAITSDNTVTTSVNLSGASGLEFTQGALQVNRSDIADLTSAQTLSNKTVLGDLTFSSTIDAVGTVGTEDGTSLSIIANNDALISSNTGDIVLRPDMLNEVGKAYVGSTTAGNEIATHSYVDSAVAGLAWKESVHLLIDARNSTTPPLTGPTGTLVIDGHPALTSSNNGYRILLLTTLGADTGIYTYNDNGTDWTLTRSEDADAVAELVGAAVFVMEGTQFNATSWVQSNHYLTAFADQNWTQFSGAGNYTAGFGINLVGREFSADTTEMATSQALGDAVANLTDYVDGFLNSNDGTVIQYIDDQDAATLLAANNFSTNLVATGDAAATPQYLAINVNDVAKQIATTTNATSAGTYAVASFQVSEYRAAEFLVKVAAGTHTELSKILLTLDNANNVAITEYGIVGTNGSLSTISAAYEQLTGTVTLTTDLPGISVVNVVGTLLA